jgi:hypothetical protein
MRRRLKNYRHGSIRRTLGAFGSRFTSVHRKQRSKYQATGRALRKTFLPAASHLAFPETGTLPGLGCWFAFDPNRMDT